MADEKEPQGMERADNVMREKIDEYKKAHPEALPDLNFELFLKSLKRMHENSPVKIARNAFDEKREWIRGTQTWNVGNVFLSEDRCVVFTVSHSDKALTADQLAEKLQDISKKLPLKDVPIMIQINEETRIKATDLYAHSLVSSMWAGLPVDIVLCYTQHKEQKKAHTATEA